MGKPKPKPHDHPSLISVYNVKFSKKKDQKEKIISEVYTHLQKVLQLQRPFETMIWMPELMLRWNRHHSCHLA
jgi:hypothetical protein